MTSGEPQDPEEESQAGSSAAVPPAPTQEEQDEATQERMLIGIGGTILVLVVVFWFIFSFIIDPEVVVDAILSLDPWQLGVPALMALAAYVFLGITSKTTLRNLSVKDATPGMYWQKRDDFNLPSADTADYAGKADRPKEDASL